MPTRVLSFCYWEAEMEECELEEEITVPRIDGGKESTHVFRCVRKKGHSLPHVPDKKRAEQYDKEDDILRLLAEM